MYIYTCENTTIIPFILDIQLVTQNVVVDESSGHVKVCLTKDKDTQEPLIVTVITSQESATGIIIILKLFFSLMYILS